MEKQVISVYRKMNKCAPASVEDILIEPLLRNLFLEACREKKALGGKTEPELLRCLVRCRKSGKLKKQLVVL